ncbi:MAG: CHAT domain-containing protein [Bacteroidetes bacterium]|nr:CHAT domain-containing protein [Fibrella sp.]
MKVCFAVIVLLGTLLVGSPATQRNPGDPVATRSQSVERYRQALALFRSESPTEQTDSLALAGFLRVARQLPATPVNALIRASCYEKAGILRQTYGRHSESLFLYRQAIQTSTQSRLPDSLLFMPYLYSGQAHYHLNSFDSAVHYFEKAETVFKRFPRQPDVQRLYNAFGAIYYEVGNYRQSVNYFQKALQLNQRKAAPDTTLRITYTNNMASALRQLGRYDSAAVLYQSLIPLNTNRDELLINLGTTYVEKKDPAVALRYLLQVSPTRSGHAMQWENAVAQAYTQQGKAKQAISHLNEALMLRQRARRQPQAKNHDVGRTYKLLGDVASQQRDPAGALRYYQQALVQLDYDFYSLDVARNPVRFAEGFRSFLLFESMVAKASCLERMAARGNRYGPLAIATYQASLRLAEHIAKSFDSEEARLFVVGKVFPVYQRAIPLLVQTYRQTGDESYLEDAFRWSERGKAVVLTISRQETESKLGAGLPDSLLARERTLKFSLSRLFVQADRASSDKQATRIMADIRDEELALSRVQDQMHDYPAYYRRKFSSDTLDVGRLRTQVLRPGTALISYFQTDSVWYAFVITRARLRCHIIPTTRLVQQSLNRLQLQLRGVGPGNTYRGNASAGFLYQKLIEPLTSELRGCSSLLIIPHNELRLLPFEVLEDRRGRLLLETFDITYQYSASFLRSDLDSPIETRQTLAVAPFSGKQPVGTFRGLPASELEIAGLAGTKLRAGQASKERFLSLARQASVIHLATHAVVNNAQPTRSFVAFYPTAGRENRLYAHEMQPGLFPNTRLVFLSACETASGRVIRGEGVMSLSRAFTYAGCANLITSLWQAEDQATAYLSTHFYTHLNKGLSVAKALQQAKLDLLGDARYAQFHTPPYWSHLVFVGLPAPSPSPSHGWLWTGLAALVSLAAGGWLWKRRVLRQ